MTATFHPLPSCYDAALQVLRAPSNDLDAIAACDVLDCSKDYLHRNEAQLTRAAIHRKSAFRAAS